MRFVCFKDATDLTSVVQATLTSEDIVVLDASGAERPWAIVITCPNDQCQNMFTSQMAAAAGDGTVTGAMPDAQALALVDAAKELGPAKALAAAGDSAKFVLERISLVALVVGGFGIFTDLGGGFNRHPWLFGAITVASALALLLAVIALFPRVGRIDAGNLLEVSSTYKSAIKWRARLAQAATVVLVVALALALVVFFVAANDDTPKATLTASYDGTGTPSLSFNADLKSIPKDATVAVTLVGLKQTSDSSGTTLAMTTGTRDRSGDATIAGKVPVTKSFKTYHVVADVDWGKQSPDGQRAHHLEETLTLTATPVAAVKAKPTTKKKAKPPKKKAKHKTTSSPTGTLPNTTAASAFDGANARSQRLGHS